MTAAGLALLKAYVMGLKTVALSGASWVAGWGEKWVRPVAEHSATPTGA